MNIVVQNNITYYYESVWRNHIDIHKKDGEGNNFPYPKEGKPFLNKYNLINILTILNKKLDQKKKYILSNYENKKKCLICGDKNISTKLYVYKNFVWEDGLIHYIDKHNIEPSEKFLDFIFLNFTKKISKKSYLKLQGKYKTMSNTTYVKLKSNQLLVLDGLMYHGGYTKKYSSNNNVFRYSEHAGLLDFHGNYLKKIIISGQTERVDKEDEDIFLPKNMKDAIEYEYLFHTHPPTPKPGGRAKDGILYEFPSIGDMLHFIDHHNDGKTIGSLVITSEGLYNIRKKNVNKKKISINEDNLFKDITQLYSQLQNNAIKKYGTKFDTYFFYSKISQDTYYINKINDTLNIYDLYIDFVPRTKDIKGKWIINKIYLPVYK